MPIASPEIQAFATGFPLTLLHAAVTLVMLIAGTAVYAMLTPHKEIALIRDGNAAAALLVAAKVATALILAAAVSA